LELTGKVILVTGGAVRVGRAICSEIARKGAKVFCHYHQSIQPAKSLQRELQDIGCEVEIFQADLMQIESGIRLLHEVINRFGRIDVLINSAALFYKTPFGFVTEKDWDTFFSLNLKQVFFLCQEAGLMMTEQKSGKIINIADAAASTPFPSYLPYSISKAALVAMTKGLAKALAPHVQVNCVNPGPVMIPESLPDDEKRSAIAQTLLKREGTAQDVAKAVRFLIEEGDYLTGVILPVDGGREIR